MAKKLGEMLQRSITRISYKEHDGMMYFLAPGLNYEDLSFGHWESFFEGPPTNVERGAA